MSCMYGDPLERNWKGNAANAILQPENTHISLYRDHRTEFHPRPRGRLMIHAERCIVRVAQPTFCFIRGAYWGNQPEGNSVSAEYATSFGCSPPLYLVPLKLTIQCHPRGCSRTARNVADEIGRTCHRSYPSRFPREPIFRFSSLYAIGKVKIQMGWGKAAGGFILVGVRAYSAHPLSQFFQHSVTFTVVKLLPCKRGRLAPL